MPRRKEPAKVCNPDKLPATRGYVKCVAKESLLHKHKKDNDTQWSALCAIFGWVFIFAAIAIEMIIYPRELVPDNFYWGVVLFTIILSIVAIDHGDNGNGYTYMAGTNDKFEPYKDPCKDPFEECLEDDE